MSVEKKAAKSNKEKSEWKSFSDVLGEMRSKRQEKKRKREEGESLVDHLTELRNRLFVAVIVFLILSFASFAFVQRITDEMLKLGTQVGFSFVYIAPSEVFAADFKVSLIIALVIDLPLILFEIWAFAAPALSKREKLVVSFCLAGGFIFFALGAVFCYLVAMPMMVRFLSNYNTSQFITASISFQNYLSFVTSMVLTFGLVFEMPIIAMLLAQFGILKPAFMKKIRKYAILVIFVVAAVITPPDVVSQVMIAVPMMVLYEISILLCRITYRKKKEKEIEEYGEEFAEETKA